MTERLYWEDITPGLTVTTGPYGASAEEMLAFAREFNPQPFHADPEAAGDTFYGGVIASGWHTCALTMRAIVDGFLCRTASLGSPGVDDARWLRPVRPGDALTLTMTCLEARPSTRRAEMGQCRFRYEVFNAEREPVMVMEGPLLFARRPAAADGSEA